MTARIAERHMIQRESVFAFRRSAKFLGPLLGCYFVLLKKNRCRIHEKSSEKILARRRVILLRLVTQATLRPQANANSVRPHRFYIASAANRDNSTRL